METPSQKELAIKNKFVAQVPIPPERDWPEFRDVAVAHPELCGEEHQMIFEGLLTEAHRRKEAERGGNQQV